MENPIPNPNSTPPNTTATNHNHQHNNSSSTTNPRRFFKSDSNKSNRSISMSDTESQASQFDSFHSPLRSDSPIRSDDPVFVSPSDASKAIVSVDKYFSPLRSPKKPSSEHLSLPATPATPDGGGKDGMWTPSPAGMVFNREVRDGVPPSGVHKMEMGLGRGGHEEVGGERRSRAAVDSILRRSKREVVMKKSALGFRVCEVILCLIAFSVMAANKTQGWSGDSFDRYKEYRFLVAVNVIGFVYSGFQACCLAYYLATGKHVISSPLCYYFDFFMDQILAYLLMSASSSAATRVNDWVSNWGKDEFTEMAGASISMSFLAFFAFALNSLICGNSLYNREST